MPQPYAFLSNGDESSQHTQKLTVGRRIERNEEQITVIGKLQKRLHKM